MRFRRRLIDGIPIAEMRVAEGWKRLSGVQTVTKLLAGADLDVTDTGLMPFLQLDAVGRSELVALGRSLPDAGTGSHTALLPIIPQSFRDFMLHEAHVINASREMARRFMPSVFPITQVFEKLARKPFPKFKPHKLWYQQPIYYLSSHINMVTDGDQLAWPRYCDALDYELEIGAVLAHPLRNATPDDAKAAIGGFVVLNDFSARDVQIDEMQSGFGPQKSKHFGSSISAEIVTADEILPRLERLTGTVKINGETIADVSSHGGQFTLPEAIAFASQSEALVPGELFGSGTLPGGAGIENGAMVGPGDTLTLTIDGLGSLTNIVGSKEP
ncbi:fumarylacetoacetate hydrolase family protein [Planktotalea sp.]|uniref:fumarylacetoacetate hydrolase family protein n=1 Tax=Planktotalea sp. TaxID=2029877 RepID=UPI00329690A2